MTIRHRPPDHPVVQAAVANTTANISALSASAVLQLALFPDTLTAWAARVHKTPAQVFNMLRRTRPYAQLRLSLAERLEVPVALLNHLIDAEPAVPVALKLPQRAPILADSGIPAGRIERPPIAWDHPPYPRYRDGTNPLERMAIARLATEATSFPGTTLISLALFPESLATWARRSGYHFNRLLSSLSGTRRFAYLDAALADRLGVTHEALDTFIRSVKDTPSTLAPAPPRRSPAEDAPPPV